MADNSQKTRQPNSWYNLILHLHPRKVNPYTLSLKLTFGLDGRAAILVVIQVFTELLLKFHSFPTPEGAYNSVLNINEWLLFGKLAHNIRHWSAVSLLWITFLHMLMALFTGAYQKPRHATCFNWHNLTFACGFIKFKRIFAPIGQAFVLGSYISYQPVIIHSH
jgi:quinol-cytochrome oxidoreductase complex cytochrome b subunit